LSATVEAIESTSTCDAFEPTTAELAFVATVAVSVSKAACEAFVPTVVVSADSSASATLLVLTKFSEPSTPTARVTVSFTGRFAIVAVDSNDTGLCIENGLPPVAVKLITFTLFSSGPEKPRWSSLKLGILVLERGL
jgi:hypothetical protein